MPYSPGGIFSLVASYFANPGTTIRTEQHNPVFEDVASALSQVVIRDGRAPMTGPLNMNGFAINGVAAGNTPGSVATLAQAMPIGAVIDFAGSTAPAGWALCYGQAISRATYSALFAVIGTTYGAGDGSTTFNLPDARGRVTAGLDNMGGAVSGRLTAAYFGAATNVLGSVGGTESWILSQAQLPSISYGLSGSADPVTVQSTLGNYLSLGGGIITTGLNNGVFPINSIPNGSAAAYVISTGSFTPRGSIGPLGSSAAHPIVQPAILFNKIIRLSYDV